MAASRVSFVFMSCLFVFVVCIFTPSEAFIRCNSTGAGTPHCILIAFISFDDCHPIHCLMRMVCGWLAVNCSSKSID
jgi:hypothetical protein